MDNKYVNVFVGVEYRPLIKPFRIMEENAIARLILSQRVATPTEFSFHDSNTLDMVCLNYTMCGRPDEYLPTDNFATFYHLRLRRYWVSSLHSRRNDFVEEWAEYETESYFIDFKRIIEIYRT